AFSIQCLLRLRRQRRLAESARSACDWISTCRDAEPPARAESETGSFDSILRDLCPLRRDQVPPALPLNVDMCIPAADGESCSSEIPLHPSSARDHGGRSK